MNKALFYLVACFVLLTECNYSVAQCMVSGSNLIPNPSFETPSASCNGADNQLYVSSSPVASWYGTDESSTANSTPDYKNNTTTNGCGGPTNTANNSCFTSAHRVGFYVYTSSGGREYIQAQLNTTLVSGQTYCFSLDARTNYGSAGNKLLDTDGIGAWFHNGGIIDIQTMNGGNQFLGTGSIINASPQVQQTSGVVISNSCTTVTGTFTASGTENYIVIGNFRTNAGTTTSGSSSSSYMYVDNLSLYPAGVVLSSGTFIAEVKCDLVEKPYIQWEYSKDDLVQSFKIEKSANGIDYVELEEIPLQSNQNNPMIYKPSYAVNNTSNYFRIKQLNKNGSFKFSNIFTLTDCSSGQLKVQVWPNPSEGNYKIENMSSENIKYEVINAIGERILAGEIDQTVIDINLRDFSDELFFLRIFCNTGINNFKLIKLK